MDQETEEQMGERLVNELAAGVRNNNEIATYALVMVTTDGQVMITGDKANDTDMLSSILRKGLAMIDDGSPNIYDVGMVH